MTMAEMPAATRTAAAIAGEPQIACALGGCRCVGSGPTVRARVSRSIRLVVSPIVTTPSSWSPSWTGALTSKRPAVRWNLSPSMWDGGSPVVIDGRTDGSGPRNRPRPAWSTTATEMTSGSAITAWMASRVASTLSSASGLTSASAVTKASPVARFSNWSLRAAAKECELASLASAIDVSYCRIRATATAAIAEVTSSMIAGEVAMVEPQPQLASPRGSVGQRHEPPRRLDARRCLPGQLVVPRTFLALSAAMPAGSVWASRKRLLDLLLQRAAASRVE